MKPEKCIFKEKEIGFLGRYIMEEGVKMDEVKVKVITEWPVPKKVKDVQSFLGLVNFYRRFIEQFSKIVTLLSKLIRKDQPWEWTDQQQNAFDTSKMQFTSYLILITVDLDKLLQVEANALDYATEAVLSMKGEDEKWRPCTFYLKSLSNVERNYDVHDKEMLGIIRVLEAWRHHLEGATHKVEIWSDHQNLQYFMGAKKLNR